jgi:plastocyanin
MLTDGSDFLFDPIGLFVEQGETITWTLESGSHSATSYTEDNPQASANRIPDDAESWNSGTLSEQGAEFTYTFEVPGTYDYYCIPHKTLGMVGRIVCQEPSGVEGDPPDGPVPAAQRIVDQGAVSQEEFNP